MALLFSLLALFIMLIVDGAIITFSIWKNKGVTGNSYKGIETTIAELI